MFSLLVVMQENSTESFLLEMANHKKSNKGWLIFADTLPHVEMKA